MKFAIQHAERDGYKKTLRGQKQSLNDLANIRKYMGYETFAIQNLSPGPSL